MNYVVRFDSLDAMNTSVRTQSDAWMKELDSVKTKVQTLIETRNMSGEGASNVKSYFGNVHLMIIGLLGQLISLHMANCQIYKSEYQSKVDTSLHAVIRSDEINDYYERLKNRRDRAVDIDQELHYAVQALKDLVYIPFSDITETKNQYNSVLTHLGNLDQQITDLENSHSKNDFVNTTQMIDSLRTFILEQSNQSRTYKSDFSVEKLAGSESFGKLYESYMAVTQECQDKAEDLKEAIDNENDRLIALQEEYEKECEERAKKAKVFKWIVTGVCIIGAVAATVATAGAASGLAAVAVAGAISATSSVVTAAAGNLADQYVAYGYDHSQYDWGSLGKDVLVAGATGFITGAVGAGVGGAVTSKLTSVGAKFVNSSSSLVRIGSNAAIGSVSEIASGAAIRGATTFVTTGSIEQAVRNTFDVSEIAKDAVSGAGGSLFDNVSDIDNVDDLLHSKSKVVRIGTSAAIGTTSEVVVGVASRGVSTLIQTGDLEQALDASVNVESVVNDAATGAIGKIGDEFASNKMAQKRADDAASAYNEKYNPYQDAQDAGIEGVKQTKNNGLDFSESEAILRTEDGTPVEIKIKATGNREKDYKLAEQMLKEQGVDIDLKQMRKRSKDGYVWHHMDDYNATTGETTMQFIKRDAHAAIENHAGSAMQYHKANGEGYGKTAFTIKDPVFKPSKAASITANSAQEVQKLQSEDLSVGKISLKTEANLSEQMAGIYGKRLGMMGV